MFHFDAKLNQVDREGKTSDARALPLDYTLGPNDVLCGRGKKCFEHVGNQIFRKLVEDTLGQYMAAPTKMEKSFLIREVIDHVRANTNGGFVKHDPLTGRFYALGDVVAREKTSQAFRDAIYSLCKSHNAAKTGKQMRVTSAILGRSQSFHQSSFDFVNPGNSSNTIFYNQETQWNTPAFCASNMLASNGIWNPEEATNKDSDRLSRTMSEPNTGRSLQTPASFDLTGSSNDEFVGEYKTTLWDANTINSIFQHCGTSIVEKNDSTNHCTDPGEFQGHSHQPLHQEKSSVFSSEPLPVADQQPLQVDQIWDHLMLLTEQNLIRFNDPFEPTPLQD